MRLTQIVLNLVLFGTMAAAAPIAPVSGGTLDGLPLAEAMASVNVLGQWRLPPGGFARLVSVIGDQVLCTADHDTDTDKCDRQSLYVVTYEAPTVPMDHMLFRLPKKICWALAKGTAPHADGKRRLAIQLSACDVEKTIVNGAPAFVFRPEAYVLLIGENVVDTGNGGRYVFSADLEPATPSVDAKCFE